MAYAPRMAVLHLAPLIRGLTGEDGARGGGWVVPSPSVQLGGGGKGRAPARCGALKRAQEHSSTTGESRCTPWWRNKGARAGLRACRREPRAGARQPGRAGGGASGQRLRAAALGQRHAVEAPRLGLLHAGRALRVWRCCRRWHWRVYAGSTLQPGPHIARAAWLSGGGCTLAPRAHRRVQGYDKALFWERLAQEAIPLIPK